MTVEHYFGKTASAYDSKRNKGFLGWLRTNERKALLSFLDFQKNDSVLDAGCGEGYYALLAKEYGANSFGVDLSQAMITRLEARGVPGKVSDIEHLSLHKKFDKIICAGVLEFTHNPGLALKILAKHLKPHGKLVILYSRPSIGTFAYVTLHRLHGLRLKILSYTYLHNLLKEAGLVITAHKKLPLFGGVAQAEHQ
ncbi:MAG: class I SAM-dependent methyltransferase [Candidatus Woesearchaeota archaeon]|nr:class I SAM-dependent methyltransferase [Candidatus Woesearchaeota archaeon]